MRTGLGVRGLGGVFIYLSHFLGYPMYHLRGKLSDIYPAIETTNYHIGLKYSLLAFFVYVVVCFLCREYEVDFNDAKTKNRLKYKLGVGVFFALFFVSTITYLTKVGFSFGGEYADRLNDNSGNGLLLMNMVAFIPAALLLSYFDFVSKKKLVIILMFCGLLYFFVVGGSRNILAAGFVSVLFLEYKKGNVNLIRLLWLGVFIVMIMNALVFLRYSIETKGLEISDLIAMIISYTADSFSPLNYQAIAVRYYSENINVDLNGFDLLINQFSGFIPRFIWADKPIVVMNNSYYFTQNILGLSGDLNMAPTMLGSSMVMLGINGFPVIYAISALILSAFEMMALSRSIELKITYLLSLPFTFFMVREGLDLYLFVVLKFSLVVIFGFMITWILYIMIPKEST